ncbi:MAG TPA: hypothetical protein VMI31_02555 [Fimbriimonadaceae bacterium]|nr:hypothetical protein [Fimbriimonadaceae bacterium]
MRTAAILLLLAAFVYSGAMFKDPRKGLHPVASPTQQQMEQMQSLQKSQGAIGSVPDKTGQSGYSPESSVDPGAAQIVAQHSGVGAAGVDAPGVLKSNEDTMQATKEKPARTMFGALWALIGGLVIAGGAWAALQKFGPKPPPHLAR